MQPFINMPIWINKSGKITLNSFFSVLVPHQGVEINFLMSDTSTWVRFQNKDGNTYAIYLPEYLPIPVGILSDNLSASRILSAGDDWQGNELPTPAIPEANLYWYGH